MNKTDKNISDMLEKSIFNKTASSLLLLILSVFDKKHKEFNFEYNSDIYNIDKKITEHIINLETTLNDNDLRKEALEDCFLLKKQLLSIYRSINNYFNKFNVIADIWGDENCLRRYRNEINDEKIKDNIEMGAFYNDCFDFLKTANNQKELNYFIGEFFNCVQLSMTKSKYFEIIQKNIIDMLKNMSEKKIDSYINMLKYKLSPEKADDYGKYFDEIADFIEKHKTVDLCDIDDNDFNTEFEDFEYTFDLLLSIKDYCQITLDNINSLIIMFYMGYTIDELSEENYGYEDVYYKVRELLKDGNETAFDDTIVDMLEKYIDQLLESAVNINSEVSKVIENTDFSKLSDDTAKMIYTNDFINACFYGDLEREILDFDISDDNIADDEYIKKSVKDFMEYLKEYITQLSNTLRKVTVKKFMFGFDMGFDIGDIMDYVKNAINATSSFEQKLLIIDKIGSVFENNGFYDAHYDEHCTCGHDHEHHHHDHSHN